MVQAKKLEGLADVCCTILKSVLGSDVQVTLTRGRKGHVSKGQSESGSFAIPREIPWNDQFFIPKDP